MRRERGGECGRATLGDGTETGLAFVEQNAPPGGEFGTLPEGNMMCSVKPLVAARKDFDTHPGCSSSSPNYSSTGDWGPHLAPPHKPQQAGLDPERVIYASLTYAAPREGFCLSCGWVVLSQLTSGDLYIQV